MNTFYKYLGIIVACALVPCLLLIFYEALCLPLMNHLAHMLMLDDELIQIEAVEFTEGSLEIYVYFEQDLATLGFAVTPHDGQSKRYYPMYVSPSRSLPDGTISILIPADLEDELWIYTSWPQWESKMHYDLSKHVCRNGRGVEPPLLGPGEDSNVSPFIPGLPFVPYEPTNEDRVVIVSISEDGRVLKVE